MAAPANPCRKCKYLATKDGVTICRRNPPTPLVVAGDQFVIGYTMDAYWPTITAPDTDTCGEFAPAPG